MSKHCCWLVTEYYLDSYVRSDAACSLLDTHTCSFLGCSHTALWGHRGAGFAYTHLHLNNEKYKCNNTIYKLTLKLIQ